MKISKKWHHQSASLLVLVILLCSTHASGYFFLDNTLQSKQFYISNNLFQINQNLATELKPNSDVVSAISPENKGESNSVYLTQFTCKLSSTDLNDSKIAALAIDEKLTLPLHFMGSNFHRQDFTLVQVMSKNLLSQGAIE